MPSGHSYSPILTHTVCKLKACSWHRRSSACRELPAASRNYTAQAGRPDLASANKDLAMANKDLARSGLNQQRSGRKWLQPSTQVLPTKQVVGLPAALTPKKRFAPQQEKQPHTVMLNGMQGRHTHQEEMLLHTSGTALPKHHHHTPSVPQLRSIQV